GATGNGSAWNNAYGSLASALTAAQAGDEIWVTAGTYKPTTGTDRNATFTLKNNVGIYGGFAGTETAQNQRNINTNVTILSGEIGVAGIADNVYHVVTATGTVSNPLTTSSILDGFTITGGNATGTTGNQGNGGGVYVSGASPTLRNITFRDNNGTNGGALYNESGSNPVLIDTLFEYNTATRGAAIYNDLSSPQITDGTFRLNTAVNDGGAIYNTSSSNPTIVNTVFSRNYANRGSGGAVFNNLSNPNFINTTFSNNVAITGGAFANNSSSVAIRNSILYGNQNSSGTNQISGGGVTVANSIIQGGGFTGATDNNPLFVNANADDLRLKAGSPALNAGDSNLLPADSRDLDGDGNTAEKIPLDLAGNTRVLGANVDLGAYEGVELAPAPTTAVSRVVYVRTGAGGSNNGTSWTDAYTSLQDALAAAQSGDKIWVTAGTYKPTTGTDRNATFTLKNNVEIYGGFAGTETSFSQRNVLTNVTTLSGDIGTVNNTADNVYHVVTSNSPANTAVLDGFTISGGNANGTGTNQNFGGGMFIPDSNPILRNLIVENNNATNSGGGLYNGTNANYSLTSSIFRNNTAGTAGAIFNNVSSPTLTDVTFTNNTATSGTAGAIYNNGGSPVFNNTTFSNNTATSNGGAILNSSSNAVFNTATFTSNTSSNNGGAIYNASSNAVFNTVTFTSNTSSNQGGAIVNSSSNAVFNTATFSGNTSTNAGGAIYNGGGGSSTLNNVTFAQNRSTTGNGGAIYNSGSTGTITQGSFQQNRAANGGAIFNDSTNNLSLTNVSFTLNIADAAGSAGGAIYNLNSINLQATNATFSRNNAASAGGAIYQYNGGVGAITTTIINSTFSGNSAALGSALYQQSSNAINNGYSINNNLRNSIIWGNGGTAIVNNGNGFSTTTINNSIVQGGQFGGTNVDPLFVDAINDDLRLQSTSPAINAGNNGFIPADTRDLDGDSNITEAIPLDIARNPRVNGTNVDMGAYEFTPPVNQPPVVTNKTFTIAKSSAVGATVGTVPISDPENNPFTVTITNGNTDTDNDGTRPFAISNAGVITVTDPGDFGTNTSFNLTIAANDGSATGTGNAVINLNSPPTVNNATFSIVNNSAVGATVGTVTASDPENNPLTFSITNGNTDTDNDGTRPFAINNSGVITVTDPGDFGTNNSFNLTVTANDGNATGNGTIVVNLTSPVNRPPVVNNAVFSISKTSPNGTVVGTINATDPDNNPLTYSITAGNPDTDGDTIKAFAISNTGVITITDANDVSAQTNPFNLTIQASDGALNGTGIATINLNNVNPLSFQLKLYEDNNGTIGNEITGNNPILGNSFFAE
ncbi:MAG: beta strand repeat-containing protein, partial [Microcystis panniformis]